MLRTMESCSSILFYLFLLIFYWSVVYNVVFVSVVQQSELVIHIHISTLF